jgi:hypothetical protein
MADHHAADPLELFERKGIRLSFAISPRVTARFEVTAIPFARLGNQQPSLLPFYDYALSMTSLVNIS